MYVCNTQSGTGHTLQARHRKPTTCEKGSSPGPMPGNKNNPATGMPNMRRHFMSHKCIPYSCSTAQLQKIGLMPERIAGLISIDLLHHLLLNKRGTFLWREQKETS